MAKIVFRSGDLIGQEVTVPEKGLTVGRSARADVVVNDRLISGEHVNIRLQDGRWWLYDMNSSNGTLVNGESVKAVELRGQDAIQLGTVQLEFFAQGEAKKPLTGGDKPQAGKTVTQKVAADPSPTKSERPAAPAIVSSTPPPQAADDVAMIREIHGSYERMKAQLGRVIVGQGQVIDEVLMAVFSRGHALLVGVPGLAKTLLISTLSHVLDLRFKRIQFTPDLMPSDITGTDVLEEDRTTGKRSFRFVHGPIFANMVLADEINRTPPKTQAALLEAMQEHRVTVGDESFHLPEPFFVLATQNPIEQEGTYPLPEAQLDRFMFNIVVDYPTPEEESQIIRQVTSSQETKLEVALDAQQVLRLQQVVRRVPVGDHVIDFARDLARATRPKAEGAPDFVKEMVGWGAGPRAGIYLVTAAKARAVLQGRYHATTADVAAVALPVLRHRVLTTFNAEAAGVTSDQIVRMLLEKLRPSEDLNV
jgi:MoxR-like ATPase